MMGKKMPILATIFKECRQQSDRNEIHCSFVIYVSMLCLWCWPCTFACEWFIHLDPFWIRLQEGYVVGDVNLMSGHVIIFLFAIQHRIDLLQEGFYSFPEGTPCPDALCPYNTRCQHFHCSQPRCFYVTDREDILIMHSKDFHDNIDIMDGFLFFDRTVDCRLPSCHRCVVRRLI